MPDPQLGFEPKGAEKIIHATREILFGNPTLDNPFNAPCRFEADEQNAYNTAPRHLLLKLAEQHWPKVLSDYAHRLYSGPVKIVAGTNELWAVDGTTQGCTFGGPLYALTTIP